MIPGIGTRSAFQGLRLFVLGLLGAFGAALLLTALLWGLALVIGPVTALALVGALCLAAAALGLADMRRRAVPPLAELGMLLGILVLRAVLKRRGAP